MSSCKFTLKNKEGNIVVDGVDEKSFKKYLAQEGLSEYIKSGDIKVDMNFLKNFIVTPKEKTTKKIISESTGAKNKPKQTPLREARKEGKYEGELKTTEKLSKQIDEAKAKLQSFRDEVKEKFAEYTKFKTEQAKTALNEARQKFSDKVNQVRELTRQRANDRVNKVKEKAKERILGIKEKGQALTDIVNGLRDEIKIQLREAKSTILKGAKVKGSVAFRMLNSLNNAKTPLQLLSAIEKLDKLLADVDYDNKVSRSKALAKTALRLSKNLPSNVRTAIKKLAKISPSGINDLNNYLQAIESVVDSIKNKGAEGINVTSINNLSEEIAKNNLKEKLERIYNVYPDLRRDVSDSIKDMQEALKEVSESLLETKDEYGEITSEEKRDALESVTEVLREDLNEYDLSDIESEDIELFKALRDVDISKLSDKELTFLNHAINNFLENGEFDGVAAKILSKYKIQQSFTNSVISAINQGKLKINALTDKLKTWGTLPTQLNAITVNENIAAMVRVATGFADHIKQYGAKNGFLDVVESGLDTIDKLAEKTGVKKSYKSQIKIGAVLDILQTKPGMTATEIQDEFDKRKSAMEQGIANAKKEMESSSEYKERNGEFVNTTEAVYNEYVKDSNTPEELLSKLTPGELVFRNAVIQKFLDLRNDLERISKIYNNKEFEIYDNYFTRTYLRPIGDSTVENPDISGMLTMSSFTGEPNMETQVSTSFDDRKINGGNVPKGSILNYSVLDVFQDNYRKQVYDVKTLPTRYHMANVLTSPEFLEALGGDKDLRNMYINAFGQRISFEKQGLKVKQNESTTEFILSMLNSVGNKIALGGILTPFLKQFFPAFSSTAINTSNRPGLIFDSLRDIVTNSDAFNKLIEQSPVYGRHKRESQYFNSQVNAKDIKDISNKLKRNIKGWDDTMDDIFMNSLKSGDQSAAGLSYLTYYKYNLLERGKIKSSAEFDLSGEAKNPDKIAQQYAEQMTSTTLNINEASDRAKKQIGGNILPFISFAVNAKANLAVNISKIANTRGVVSAKDKYDATRRIAAHAMEILVINLIGHAQRNLMIGIGTSATAILMGIGADDEEKEKINKAAGKIKEDFKQKNWENSWKYITADLLTGQIAESFTKPALDQIWTPITETYAKITGEVVDKAPTPYNTTDALAILGSRGIPIVKTIELMKNAGNLLESDTLFQKQKFGYMNSRDEVAIPHWAQELDKPIGERIAFGTSTLINLISILGASSQEINTMARTISRVTLRLEAETIGKDKNLKNLFKKDDDSIHGYNKIEDKNATIKYNGVEYYLTPDQLSEWNRARELSVKKEYPGIYNAMKSSIPEISKQLKEVKKVIPIFDLKDAMIKLKYPEDESEKIIADISRQMATVDIINKYMNPKDKSKLKLNKKKQDAE
jgi:hypothetical protein